MDVRGPDDYTRHNAEVSLVGSSVVETDDVQPMTRISGRTLLQLAFLTCRAGRPDAIRVCQRIEIYRGAVSPMLQPSC